MNGLLKYAHRDGLLENANAVNSSLLLKKVILMYLLLSQNQNAFLTLKKTKILTSIPFHCGTLIF